MTQKVALVTGSAAGIGAAIAKRLAKDDIAIGLLDLNLEATSLVAEEIRTAGGKAIALQASIADRAQVEAAADALRAEFGPITIVVNNAGITGVVPFLEITEEQWDTMLGINLKGTVIVTQTVLPDMIEKGWGRVVNISSSSAQSGSAGMTHYSASKGGMIALTKSLAQEFGPQGITCNNIPPRFVMNTIMSEATLSEEVKERMTKAGPITRAGAPEDIAGAAAWLVSDEAGYVTGQTIGVNGGRYI